MTGYDILQNGIATMILIAASTVDGVYGVQRLMFNLFLLFLGWRIWS